MTDPERDEAFETYLKRRSVLPDALASDEQLKPPAALDAIVLRKAREAIEAQAAPDQMKRQPQRPPRWAVPVALAATIMLCLSVVMNISLNTSRPAATLEHETAARADGDSDGELRKSVSGDIPSHEVILPEAKVAGSPAPHAPVVAEQAERAPPAADEGRVAGRSATEKTTMFAKRADASVPGAAPSAAGASQSAAGGRHPSDPNEWLQQIEALRAAGKIELADAEMRRFQAAFPGYAVKRTPPAPSEPPK
jgi:hypothetical protein